MIKPLAARVESPYLNGQSRVMEVPLMTPWNTSLSLLSKETGVGFDFVLFIPLMMYDVANPYFKNSKRHRCTVLKTYFRSLQVTCSYLQIYQERVYDLLGSEKSGPEVFLREHPKKGMVID